MEWKVVSVFNGMPFIIFLHSMYYFSAVLDMGSYMKCIYCGDETQADMPIEVFNIAFFKFEIRLWKWIKCDICNECMADKAQESSRESYHAGYDAGVNAVLEGKK